MGQYLSKNRNLLLLILAGAGAYGYYEYSQGKKKSKLPAEKGKRRFSVKLFFQQLKRLAKICFPGPLSKSTILLICHGIALVIRTVLSIKVADLDGEIVKALVDRKKGEFAKGIMMWMGIAVPSTLTNAMLHYLESKLGTAFRTRLSEHFYEAYMKDETYYRVGQLDSRLANTDQLLTEDISQFCTSLARLWSQVSKPWLDVMLITVRLVMLAYEMGTSWSGSLTLAMVSVFFTATLLRVVTPPFGRLVAEQAALEGELRTAHSRLINNAEEIAFYRGHSIERVFLRESYTRLVKHMNVILWKRAWYNSVESFLMKYVWTGTGMCMVALPNFEEGARRGDNDKVAQNTRDFTVARSLLVTASDAIERILASYKELTELAGYTSRVSEMLDVFGDVGKGKYVKDASTANTFDLSKRGEVIQGDKVSMDHVPVVTPSGDILINDVNFNIPEGTHVFISGPNGCGKSSLFRVLKGLWPTYDGTVTKPPRKDMFFVPQRTYLVLGNLREQVIYPDTVADMRAKKVTDEMLMALAEAVKLKHIVEREGWDIERDWEDVLSGGEKQRLGMARLFYHAPKFAILDECTSAVSSDVGALYQHAKRQGITLVSVSHRHTLLKYHTHLMRFDGKQGVQFTELNTTAHKNLEDEMEHLEQQLVDVPSMEARLRELCVLLGEDSHVLAQRARTV